MSGTWASSWALNDIVSVAEFAKGMGSVADSTLGVAAASIDLTGLPTTYAHMRIEVYARSDTAATNANLMLRFNNDATAIYDYQRLYASASTTVTAADSTAQTAIVVGFIPAGTATANLFGSCSIFVPHYAGSINNKLAVSNHAMKSANSAANLITGTDGGHWRSNAAINRVTLFASAGNLAAGTRVTVYVMGA